MATSTADPAPLARAAVRRYYPRQEPSAVVPHAGICAGGGRQRPSLPQPIPAAPRRRMRRPCPIGRDPKGSPCRCPADRPWTGPTTPSRPRLIGGCSYVKEKLLVERLQWMVRTLLAGLAGVVSVGAAVGAGGWRSFQTRRARWRLRQRRASRRVLPSACLRAR